jgi:hypothetical protein
MIDKRILLKNAIEHTRGLDFSASAYGDKRTLFGVLRSLVRIALKSKGNQLEVCRKVLERIGKLSGNHFKGVKLNELQRLIKFLFEDGGEMLSPTYFKDYSIDDVLGYLEICRRIFIARVEFEQPAVPQTSEDEPTESPSRKWAFYGLGVLKVKWDLKNGDKECARFVIEHGDRHLNAGLIEEAERLLKGSA